MKRRTLLAAAATALARPALSQNASRVIRFVPQANLPTPTRSGPPPSSPPTTATWCGTSSTASTKASTPSRRWWPATISDDKLTWTLTLRDGLLFHDGEPVRRGLRRLLARWMKRDGFGQRLASQMDEMKASTTRPSRSA